MRLLTHKFTVEQYHKMADVGILSNQDRVELIAGEIIQMSPIGVKHASSVNRLNRIFNKKLGDKVLVSIQNPIQLSEISEPQPDVVLLKYQEDFYEDKIPQSEDIYLIVEVADTTIKYDRETKVPLYAKKNIIEVWLVDLNSNALEVYRQPAQGGYQTVQTLKSGETLAPVSFPEIRFSVGEILGRSKA
jgi:Uma2 family endonuclease